MECRKTFISDNHYFCMGASALNVDNILSVGDRQIIEVLDSIPADGFFIIAIEDFIMRFLILQKVKYFSDSIIILDRDLCEGTHLSFGKVTYTSQYTSIFDIFDIMQNTRPLTKLRFTHRQMQVLRLSDLSDSELSAMISISAKTISAHRIILHNKLSLKYRNNVALERVRRKFGIHLNSFTSSATWDFLHYNRE